MSCKLAADGEGPAPRPLVLRQMSPAEGASGTPPDDPARAARQEAEAAQRAAEARAAGFREGEAAGRSRASAELKPVLERLAATIREMSGLRDRFRREAESDMVRLALAIARRILRRELALDPEALHGLVLAALEKMQANEICRVRACPAHAALLKTMLGEAAGRPVEIVLDPSCQPGGVIFESERGDLDASVETQLGEIERGLADLLRRRA